MGNNCSTSSLTNPEYSLILSSKSPIYRCSSTIEGELHINIRKTLFIEKKIHIDLIGEFLEKNYPDEQRGIFFTYSFPLITSHENGIEKMLKEQQISFPFRIPLSPNLPPSCDLSEFAIEYHLDVFHDDQLLLNLRKQLILVPTKPYVNIPVPCQVTGSNDVKIVCSLTKSCYSLRENSIVPLTISINNPRRKCIYCLKIQLIRIVSFNGLIFENEIFTRLINEIEENTREIQINMITLLNLPSNLPPSNLPNPHFHAENIPSISIKYEFRLLAHIEGLINPNLHVHVPIGIE